ncbi:MAG: winged helix-turn-helix transcriptional regulator [Acidobacteria bacterium]|nr:winged helix-turn-helix transcriptional regulator [Acidobacteriota bacterium]
MRFLEPPQDTSLAAKEARAIGSEILGRCVGGRTRLIARVITAHYDEALRPSGLRAGQLTMLAIAGTVDRVRPAELQELLAMDKSTVSRNVKVVVDHGWLERLDDEAGRGYGLRLTSAGRERLKLALPIWRKAQEEAAELLMPPIFAALKLVGDSLLAKSEYHIDIGEFQPTMPTPEAMAALASL